MNDSDKTALEGMLSVNLAALGLDPNKHSRLIQTVGALATVAYDMGRKRGSLDVKDSMDRMLGMMRSEHIEADQGRDGSEGSGEDFPREDDPGTEAEGGG